VHELHAVEALIERVRETSFEGVAEVRVRAGGSYSPEALEQAYEMLTPGTSLEGSRLIVEPVPDTCVCSSCGRSWQVARDDLAGLVAVCPFCGSPSPIEGLAGVELIGVS
jgi:hydrogenase nickel incorporation protein HypA/HybF